MDNCSLVHHESLETALIEAGFKVEDVVKHGKRTVITVKPSLKVKGKRICKKGQNEN